MIKKTILGICLALCLVSCQQENTGQAQDKASIRPSYDLAQDYFSQGAYHQAIDALKKSDHADPNNLKVKAYIQLGHFQKALGLLEAYPNQEDPEVLTLYGDLYSHRFYLNHQSDFYNVLTDKADALSYYDRVLDLQPNHPQALLGKGKLYGYQNLISDQLDYLEQAARAGDSLDLNLVLLDAYIKNYKLPDFEALINQLYKSAPDNYSYAKYYGLLLEEKASVDEVDSHYQQMVRDYPEEEACTGLLAAYYYKKGLYQESLSDLEAYDPMTKDDQIISLYLDVLSANQMTQKIQSLSQVLLDKDQAGMAYYFQAQAAYMSFDFIAREEYLLLSLTTRPDPKTYDILLNLLKNGSNYNLFEDTFMDYLDQFPLRADTSNLFYYLVKTSQRPQEVMEEVYDLYGSEDFILAAASQAYANSDFKTMALILDYLLDLDKGNQESHYLALYGFSQYLLGKNDLAITYFDQVPKDLVAYYLDLIDTRKMDLDDYDAYMNFYRDYAQEDQVMGDILQLHTWYGDNPHLTQRIASHYSYYGRHMKALDYAKITYDLDPSLSNELLLMVYQYKADRLIEAEQIAYGLLENEATRQTALYYLGLIHHNYIDVAKTISYFKQVMEAEDDQVDEGDYYRTTACYYLADTYTHQLGDFEMAQTYIDTYESTHTYIDDWVEDLRTYIASQDKQEDDTRYIEDIFSNYIYSFDPQVFDDYQGKLTNQEVEDLFYQLVDEEDPYSYVLFKDQPQDQLPKPKSNLAAISHKVLDDHLVYIDINEFTKKVQYDMIHLLDRIDHKRDTKLIIDLRDNTGGYAAGAALILDQLLGQQELFRIDYNHNDSYTYQSDDFHYTFDHIYILINQKTASASESFTLSLSSSLDNVTLIGRRSHGKGVSQRIFFHWPTKRIYCLVNGRVFINDITIHKTGIIPDYEMEDAEILQYFKETYGVEGFHTDVNKH